MTFEVVPKQLYEELWRAGKAKQNSQKMSKDTPWGGLRKAKNKIVNQIAPKDTTWRCTMSKDTAQEWAVNKKNHRA